jgi:hypothetical protein
MGRPANFGLSETEFSSLLQALSSTTKGRRFLEEYRRRSQPEDTLGLLHSMQQIESALALVRNQLQPERIADELRRIGMALDIALDGAKADSAGDETARRFALIRHTRGEIEVLASSFAGGNTDEMDEIDDAGEADEEGKAVEAPSAFDDESTDEAFLLPTDGIGYRLRDPSDR